MVISLLLALILFTLLCNCSIAAFEVIFYARDIVLTDAQLMDLDAWIFNVSFLISVVFFLLLFLFLLGERLSYIRDILQGIDALQSGRTDHRVPEEGNNELTELAKAVNYLAATQQQVREKERALGEEKEQLIRTLSHDIRTPLTSIMSYSELLCGQERCSPEALQAYGELIRKKAGQIKDLTDILLDGGKRNPEHFDDARLLFAQLAEEFGEGLEEDFQIEISLADQTAFSGSFDIQELRRIFDNLSSNVGKYACREHPVLLSISIEDRKLVIRQKNIKAPFPEPQESYQMGLNSIRRIAHNYAGSVDIQQDETTFQITITLSEF